MQEVLLTASSRAVPRVVDAARHLRKSSNSQSSSDRKYHQLHIECRRRYPMTCKPYTRLVLCHKAMRSVRDHNSGRNDAGQAVLYIEIDRRKSVLALTPKT